MNMNNPSEGEAGQKSLCQIFFKAKITKKEFRVQTWEMVVNSQRGSNENEKVRGRVPESTLAPPKIDRAALARLADMLLICGR